MDIKLLVMDVDGTLTDGKIYMSDKGELMKAFNIKDGYGIAHLKEKGVVPAIITGRSSTILENRCNELGITELHQGVEDKVKKLYIVCEKYHITPKQVAYIGDDLNDLDCMRVCRYTAAPADAVEEIRKSVDFVCKHNGGEGAVREFIDQL